MTDLEVRGFLVTGCKSCPFVETDLGGYDRNEILGYYCKLYSREFEGKGDGYYHGGCKNEVPDGFAKFCRLKNVEDRNAKIYQKYKRVVDLLKTANSVIEE
jgi:hypothetical protein